MKEKIEGVFNALQKLDIKGTPNNVEVLCEVYAVLRDVYQEMEEAEKNAGEKGPEADPGGRNQA